MMFQLLIAFTTIYDVCVRRLTRTPWAYRSYRAIKILLSRSFIDTFSFYTNSLALRVLDPGTLADRVLPLSVLWRFWNFWRRLCFRYKTGFSRRRSRRLNSFSISGIANRLHGSRFDLIRLRLNRLKPKPLSRRGRRVSNLILRTDSGRTLLVSSLCWTILSMICLVSNLRNPWINR